MIQARLLYITLFTLAIVGCTSDALRAPPLDDNKLYFSCTGQLFSTYAALESHKDLIPAPVKQRVISLLIAAEIDGQFKHYPTCVDKLARAHFFLTQVKPDIFMPMDAEPADVTVMH